MPPEAHSADDNPLFSLMVRKLPQLRAAAPGTLKFIFLADVGSTLLNRLGTVGEIDATRRRTCGQEIISRFMSQYDRLDGVAVFSPRRFGALGISTELRWEVSLFENVPSSSMLEGLSQVARMLPKPRFEGYQARSLFRQGAFLPDAKGWHLGMSITGGIGQSLSVKISARKLLDLLAGRITERQFRHSIGGGTDNVFKLWLDQGMTIASAHMVPRDVDEDDDHIVLSFGDDPSARRLRLER